MTTTLKVQSLWCHTCHTWVKPHKLQWFKVPEPSGRWDIGPMWAHCAEGHPIAAIVKPASKRYVNPYKSE